VTPDPGDGRQAGDAVIALARAALERGDYGQVGRLLEPLAAGKGSAVDAEILLMLATARLGQGQGEAALVWCKRLRAHPDATMRAQARELQRVLEAPALERPRDWSLTLPDLGGSEAAMGRRMGEQVRRRRRIQPPPPPAPAVGPTRAPLGFALVVSVLMLLVLLLGGCGAIDAELQFGAAGRLQLQLGLQHEGLAAQAWQTQLARDLQAQGWSQRHSGLQWMLRSPVLPSKQALDELARTLQRASVLAGLDLPPPQLAVRSRNWLVGIHERISLELDLQRLPAWVPAGLSVRLEPLNARAVRSAWPQPRSNRTGLIWTLEAGAHNHLVLALWRWSALGLGSVAIAALLLLSLVLQLLRRQLGYGWPGLPR
jgi:hypothetical protein